MDWSAVKSRAYQMVLGISEYGAFIGGLYATNKAFGGDVPIWMIPVIIVAGAPVAIDGIVRVSMGRSAYRLSGEEPSTEPTVTEQPIIDIPEEDILAVEFAGGVPCTYLDSKPFHLEPKASAETGEPLNRRNYSIGMMPLVDGLEDLDEPII